MIVFDPRSTDCVFGFRVSGKLTRDDYRRFLPRLEEAIKEHGKISLLVHVESLDGIELGALWEELKFDVRHIRHFDRIALVGDKKWYERSMRLADHVTPAHAKYFPSAELDDGWEWITRGEPTEESGMSPSHESTIRSILYATDFSENANTALRWAIMIAKAHDAVISVLHVAHVTSISSLPLSIQEQIARSLESVEAGIAADGVQTNSRWQIGKPWEVISAESQEHDLVVIGARGHTPFLHLPIGSTADRVLRMASVPVLTVHHHDSALEHLPRNVIVPTDFSESASLALDCLVRIFGIPSDDKLNITLLHAWQSLVEYGDAYAAVPPPSPYVGTEEQATQILKRLADKARTNTVNVQPVIRQGYPVKVIEEEAEAINAELIAMGTHGHSGLARFMLGSVAERVMHRTQCPVLSVSLAAKETPEQVRAAEAAAVAT